MKSQTANKLSVFLILENFCKNKANSLTFPVLKTCQEKHTSKILTIFKEDSFFFVKMMVVLRRNLYPDILLSKDVNTVN